MCVNTPDDDFAFLLGLVLCLFTRVGTRVSIHPRHTQGNEGTSKKAHTGQ